MSRHVWKLVWQEFRKQKHQCPACKLVRLRTFNTEGFPVSKYVLDGVEFDKARECERVTA